MEAVPKNQYDAVIVGARCAGAATALLLARRGLRVLVFDRDRRGADTLSTLALMRAGVLQLHRWGLLDEVQKSGAQAIRSTSFVYGDETITVPIKPRDGVDALYAPRRTVLDTLLADAAQAAGAEVRYGPRLADVLRDSRGRVTGAVLEEREGFLDRIQSGIVIGADGMRSTMARMVEAAPYRQGRNACGVVYTFWRGLENRGNRWYYRPRMSAGAIPTNNGETLVFVATPPERFHAELQGDMEAGYLRVLTECAPELAEEVRAATRSERFRGFPGLPGYMRQSHGPGWALVGDAGYFKDPITAHGISDALRDAEFGARAVVQGSERALAEYQETRDELSRDLFELTETIAGLDWTLPDLQSMHRNLSKAMNIEVEALLELDGPAEPPVEASPVARDGRSGS
jgi:flavin-dependent dehydrogenase